MNVGVAGRRWVHDSPGGADNTIWVQSASPLLAEPERLIPGSVAMPEVPEADVLAAIERRWTGAKPIRARTPGERYARMWRGKYSIQPAEEVESVTNAANAAHVIVDRCRQVLRIVEPHQNNRAAFGHELRQLLILSSTEVESAWKSILVANKYPAPPRGRFTTNDYVKLRDALRLDEWEVSLTMYPRYGVVAPFRGWDPARPTESLAWYADYNETKHDREMKLEKATLENLISALAGVYVMLASQAGPEWLTKAPYGISDFKATRTPKWDIADEYVPAITDSTIVQGSPTIIAYPF